MPRREPKRLEAMPEHGRVLVGHPEREAAVRTKARELLCDYRLSSMVPPGRDAYLFNLDQFNAMSSVLNWRDLT